jgi:hypothetical protein
MLKEEMNLSIMRVPVAVKARGRRSFWQGVGFVLWVLCLFLFFLHFLFLFLDVLTINSGVLRSALRYFYKAL